MDAERARTASTAVVPNGPPGAQPLGWASRKTARRADQRRESAAQKRAGKVKEQRELGECGSSEGDSDDTAASAARRFATVRFSAGGSASGASAMDSAMGGAEPPADIR